MPTAHRFFLCLKLRQEGEAVVSWRMVVWTTGHSQRGLRPEKELIGDRELESTVTLDDSEGKILNPDSDSAIPTISCRGRAGE